MLTLILVRIFLFLGYKFKLVFYNVIRDFFDLVLIKDLFSDFLKVKFRK